MLFSTKHMFKQYLNRQRDINSIISQYRHFVTFVTNQEHALKLGKISVLSRKTFSKACNTDSKLCAYSTGKTHEHTDSNNLNKLCQRTFKINHEQIRRYGKKSTENSKNTKINSKSTVNKSEVPDIDYQAYAKLLPLHYIFVKTSVGRWIDFPEGVQFDVAFVDSMAGQPYDSGIPVILGLPSCVGSHMELTKVLAIFVRLGCRVIIPNMPGSHFAQARTRSDQSIFMYSVEEKAEYLKDFLSEIDIPRVDMLVTNSCSVYTGLHMCVHYSQLVNSFAMLNPTGLQLTPAMQPLIFHQNVKNMLEDVYYAYPIYNTVCTIVKQFTQKRTWLNTNVFIFSLTVANLDLQQSKLTADNLVNKPIPMLAIYGDDCDSLDRKSTEELLGSLGIPPSLVTVYDENNKITKKRGSQDEEGPSIGGVHVSGTTADVLLTTKMPVIKKLLWNFLNTFRKDLKKTL